MASTHYKFYDDYGRPHHQQVYLSGGEHVDGAYIDTFELALKAPVEGAELERVLSLLAEHFGKENMLRVAWPEVGRRIYVGLQRAHYKVDILVKALVDAGVQVEHHGCFYSGRLGKVEAPVGSQSPSSP